MIAGPNGSGKSSSYQLVDIDGWNESVWIINPDLLARTIHEQEGREALAANLAAVERIETWLKASIAVYQTIGVETVLSTGKYRPLVESAQAAGFEVRMIYVLLRSAELQRQRIAIRVSEGGHDVPADKIADRRARSFEQFAWFADRVDQCLIFDNSTGTPRLLGLKQRRDQPLSLIGRLPDDLMTILTENSTRIAVNLPPRKPRRRTRRKRRTAP